MPTSNPTLSHYIKECYNKMHSVWLIFDEHGNIIVSGAMTERSLGYPISMLEGTDVMMIIKPEDRIRVRSIMDSLLAGEQDIIKSEIEMVNREGHLSMVGIQMFLVRSREGTMQICLAGMDISFYKDNQWSMEMMNKKLNILGSATRHDVLNSLTGLFGYLELAEVKNKDENVAKFIKKAKASAETIKKQIEFTRTYQELGSKKPSWINVRDVIRLSYAGLNEPRLPLNVDVDDVEVYADQMLEKVFFNIMENAQRHAEATEMSITFRRKGDEGEIVIEDDGKGVPENEKDFIFKRGYGKNTGFGLYLSREVLEITGMKIVENGAEGRGARFVITIPPNRFRTGQ
ncbi:MAG: sensory histidine kinase AtoS [Methanomassiliicoccales archaeon PtaU1.Bin124]|nr:MAG: sensory histidine kinase AtoS [Methanomassiliicoccales archaeon PtaU1.Bin124]